MTKEISLTDAKCKSVSIETPVLFGQEDRKNSDFIMEAYTGAVVDRWWGKLVISIDGIQAKKNMPIFRDHIRNHIVGFSNDTWKNGSFFVSGNFSKVTTHAEEVKGLANEGFPWQASIGVMPLKLLSLEENATETVNGKKLKGPAEIWLESEVIETSFVPLGADGKTSVSKFSKFDEEEAPTGVKLKPSIKGDRKTMEITMAVLEKDAPDLLNKIKTDARAEGFNEGVTSECQRIKSVQEQSMKGHEKLIAELMYDGKTTGPEAAVKVLQAEKQIRKNFSDQMDEDRPNPVAQPIVNPIEPEQELNSDAPAKERAQAKWDADVKLRNEFDGKFETYLAYFEAVDNGSVKQATKKA